MDNVDHQQSVRACRRRWPVAAACKTVSVAKKLAVVYSLRLGPHQSGAQDFYDGTRHVFNANGSSANKSLQKKISRNCSALQRDSARSEGHLPIKFHRKQRQLCFYFGKTSPHYWRRNSKDGKKVAAQNSMEKCTCAARRPPRQSDESLATVAQKIISPANGHRQRRKKEVRPSAQGNRGKTFTSTRADDKDGGFWECCV